MPALPFCARSSLPARFATPHDFFEALATGSDESTLRPIVNRRAAFFVGGRGVRLVVEEARNANAGHPVDIRLERTWRELGWFRRVVVTLLRCVVPRDTNRCARPHRGQLRAVSNAIGRLRQRAGVAGAAAAPPQGEPAMPGNSGIAVANPPPPIAPSMPPELYRERLRSLADRIGKASRCKLFESKERWRDVVLSVARNDPPECLDVVAAVVLAQMAAVVTYLRRSRAGNESSAYPQVRDVMQAICNAADAEDDKLADLAVRLTEVWKQHWWRGESARHSPFREFKLPVGVVRRIGASLRDDWLLVADEFCTLELRDREIKRLIVAASARSITTATGPADPSPSIR